MTYGVAHIGRVERLDASSGGYYLSGIALARTSLWGPVPSCVGKLEQGDKVVCVATGSSRDNLTIISRIGGDLPPDIGEIPDLQAALDAKADDSEITVINGALTVLDDRVDDLEAGGGDHEARLDAAELTIADHETRLDTIEPALAGVPGQISAAVDTASGASRGALQERIADAFTRSVSDGWGVASSGQAWASFGGLTADHAVNGTQGVQTLGSVGVLRYSILDVEVSECSVAATVATDKVAVGNWITARMITGYADGSNYYQAQVEFKHTGQVGVSITRISGGVNTFLGGTELGNYVAGERFGVRLQVDDRKVRAKIWRAVSGEPTTWTVVADDTLIKPTGAIVLASALLSGTTTVLPVTITWDDLTIPSWPGCAWRSMFNTSGQSITSTASAFNTVINWQDDAGAPSNTQSEITYGAGVFTVARAGRYAVHYGIVMSMGSGSTGRAAAIISPSQGHPKMRSYGKSTTAVEFANPGLSAIVVLPAGGTVTTHVFQNTGGTLALATGSSGEQMNHFQIAYLGPP